MKNYPLKLEDDLQILATVCHDLRESLRCVQIVVLLGDHGAEIELAGIDGIDQFDEVSRENLLQAYYKGDPSVLLKDSSYYYVGSGDGGNITYTTNGKNVYSLSTYLSLN